jgi:hypothetical protein
MGKVLQKISTVFRCLLAQLEVMLHCRANLHFDLFLHFFPQFVLVAHHNKETHCKKSGQSQYEENYANHNLIGSCSHILNAPFTFFKAHFTANCCLKVRLTVNLKLQ